MFGRESPPFPYACRGESGFGPKFSIGQEIINRSGECLLHVRDPTQRVLGFSHTVEPGRVASALKGFHEPARLAQSQAEVGDEQVVIALRFPARLIQSGLELLDGSREFTELPVEMVFLIFSGLPIHDFFSSIDAPRVSSAIRKTHSSSGRQKTIQEACQGAGGYRGTVGPGEAPAAGPLSPSGIRFGRNPSGGLGRGGIEGAVPRFETGAREPSPGDVEVAGFAPGDLSLPRLACFLDDCFQEERDHAKKR
jgi:hypothetical protein